MLLISTPVMPIHTATEMKNDRLKLTGADFGLVSLFIALCDVSIVLIAKQSRYRLVEVARDM